MAKTPVNPTLLALIICDYVIRDADSNKLSLVGLFNQIKAPKAPLLHSNMNVFLSLTSGRGKVPVELRLSLAGSEDQPLFQLPGLAEFSTPNDIAEFNFGIRNFIFPQFGTYRFEVFSGSEYIGGRPFIVSSMESAS